MITDVSGNQNPPENLELYYGGLIVGGNKNFVFIIDFPKKWMGVSLYIEGHIVNFLSHHPYIAFEPKYPYPFPQGLTVFEVYNGTMNFELPNIRFHIMFLMSQHFLP